MRNRENELMHCGLCGTASGSEPLCDECAEEYFAHDCASCGATIIHLRRPISGRCSSCSDPNTVGPLSDEDLARVDALIADDSWLDACRLIMHSTPCSLQHAVHLVEERKRELAGAE